MFSSISYSQSEFNLVPNPSFEEVEKRIKGAGEVYQAAPWRAVTANPVDLYSADSKSKEHSVPENKYGKEKARTGVRYAGVSFYGHRGRLPRTYLGTQLKNPLTAGREYCVKFHISLSDKSKYAVNNLGVYLSNEEVQEGTEGNLGFEPQVMSVTNDVYEKQFLWEPICRTYKAVGGEEYLVIGNFFADEKTKLEPLKLSKEFSGRQTYDAYYYIDDVSVIPMEQLGDGACACDKIAGGQLKVEYKSFGTEEEKRASAKKTYIVNSDGSKAKETIAKEKEGDEVKTFSSETTSTSSETEAVFDIAKVNVYFDIKGLQPMDSEQTKVDQIIAYLNNNPDQNIELVGHIDESESDVKSLGMRRAFMVKKMLVDGGVDASRIKYSNSGSGDPQSKSDSSKNQRLTIKLL